MNGNFGGYLLICVSAAFIAAASFEEVMNSTEQRLMMTRFRLASGYQLYIETATIVQGIIQFAFVIGPIIGGYLSDKYEAKNACTILAVVGMNFVVLYAIFALIVHCLSKGEQKEVDLNVEDTQSEVESLPEVRNTFTSDSEVVM